MGKTNQQKRTRIGNRTKQLRTLIKINDAPDINLLYRLTLMNLLKQIMVSYKDTYHAIEAERIYEKISGALYSRKQMIEMTKSLLA